MAIVTLQHLDSLIHAISFLKLIIRGSWVLGIIDLLSYLSIVSFNFRNHHGSLLQFLAQTYADIL